MFRLHGRKQEAKDKESRALGEGQVAEAIGDNGDGKKLVDLLNELVEQRHASSSASVRSIIKAAIISAEQIIDSVKMRALGEAQQEAVQIIIEAKREAQRIKEVETPVQEDAAEDIIFEAEKAGGERVEETTHTQEEAVQLQEEVAERTMEAETPQQEESVSVEAVVEEEVSGKVEAEEGAGKEESETIATKAERESLYTGEVELTVEAPLEPTIISKLYNFLQTTPEIKFIRTMGSWNKGSIIIIMLDKPISLLSVLAAKLPEADVVPERDVHTADRRRARKITISLRNK